MKCRNHVNANILDIRHQTLDSTETQNIQHSSFEAVAQISCTSTQSSLSVVCGVISGFVNHYMVISDEPLNFHCNKFLLQKHFI